MNSYLHLSLDLIEDLRKDKHITSKDLKLVARLLDPVVNDTKMSRWPASCTDADRTPIHHGEVGGLARHTYEVLCFAVNTAKAFPNTIGFTTLVLGAMWHDFGKTQEYEEVGAEGGVFVRSKAGRLVPHLCRSLVEWEIAIMDSLVPDDLALAVSHLIVAHHGQRAWGSPVEPRTLEATILHSADMMSVMMDKTIH